MLFGILRILRFKPELEFSFVLARSSGNACIYLLYALVRSGMCFAEHKDSPYCHSYIFLFSGMCF